MNYRLARFENRRQISKWHTCLLNQATPHFRGFQTLTPTAGPDSEGPTMQSTVTQVVIQQCHRSSVFKNSVNSPFSIFTFRESLPIKCEATPANDAQGCIIQGFCVHYDVHSSSKPAFSPSARLLAALRPISMMEMRRHEVAEFDLRWLQRKGYICVSWPGKELLSNGLASTPSLAIGRTSRRNRSGQSHPRAFQDRMLGSSGARKSSNSTSFTPRPAPAFELTLGGRFPHACPDL